MWIVYLSKKNIGSAVDWFGRSGSYWYLKKPTDFLYDQLHDSVIVKNVDHETE